MNHSWPPWHPAARHVATVVTVPSMAAVVVYPGCECTGTGVKGGGCTGTVCTGGTDPVSMAGGTDPVSMAGVTARVLLP